MKSSAKQQSVTKSLDQRETHDGALLVNYRSLMKQKSKVISCNLWPDTQSECEIPRTVVMIAISQICSLFGIKAEIPKRKKRPIL